LSCLILDPFTTLASSFSDSSSISFLTLS
jgi:hypothetical protein